MLQKIAIDNFRGIKALAADLSPVTTLMGPNSSGKTSVLHAIRLASEALEDALTSDVAARVRTLEGEKWIVLTADSIITDYTRMLPLTDWRSLFEGGAPQKKDSFSIQLHFAEDDPIQIVRMQVTCASNDQLKLWVGVRSHQALKQVEGLSTRSSLVNRRLTEHVRSHAPKAVFIPPFYGTVRQEEYRTRVVVDRLLGSGDQSHVVRNLIFRLDLDQFEQLNAFLRATIKAELTYRTSADARETEFPLQLRFADSNGELELTAAGAGLINLIALYAALARWQEESKKRAVLFLLDEPEAHLHPRLQAHSSQALATLVTRQFGAQLLMATHSVDIINRMADQGARLLRIDRSAALAVISVDSHSALFTELSRWVDLTAFTALNFLSARQVLFCEGSSDVAVITKLGAVRFRNNPKLAARFSAWRLVKLSGSGNASQARLLASLLSGDAIQARAEAQTFSLITVLDRDLERSPGLSQAETIDAITERRLVWSRHSLESLFVEPRVLSVWIRAFAGGDVPDDLEGLIAEAIAEADADQELRDQVVPQLAAALRKRGIRDTKGHAMTGERLLTHAIRKAMEMVSQSPGTWQRGKDRCAFVLGRIRPHLKQPSRNRMTTDLSKLLQRTDIHRIGDLEGAVPAELATLLDLMVQSERALS